MLIVHHLHIKWKDIDLMGKQNFSYQYTIYIFCYKMHWRVCWVDDRPDLMADWRVSRTRCSVSSDACHKTSMYLFPSKSRSRWGLQFYKITCLRRSTRDESMPMMVGWIELWLDSGISWASALHAPTLTGGGLPNISPMNTVLHCVRNWKTRKFVGLHIWGNCMSSIA